MAFQLGTEKSLDGIVNYFFRFGLCLKINQTSFMETLPRIERKMNLYINITIKERIANLDIFLYFIINFRKSQKWSLTVVVE